MFCLLVVQDHQRQCLVRLSLLVRTCSLLTTEPQLGIGYDEVLRQFSVKEEEEGGESQPVGEKEGEEREPQLAQAVIEREGSSTVDSEVCYLTKAIYVLSQQSTCTCVTVILHV